MRSRSEQRSAALHAARWAARPRTRIAPLQPNPSFANPSGATAPRTGLCGTGRKSSALAAAKSRGRSALPAGGAATRRDAELRHSAGQREPQLPTEV